MPGSGAVLDWITQVSKKSWAKPRVTGDLVKLLDAILDLQGNYCGMAGQQDGCLVATLRPIPSNVAGYKGS
jgi:hypothetical protein